MTCPVVTRINNVEFIARAECIVNSNHTLHHVRTVKNIDGVYGNYDILFCDECGIGYTSPYPSLETVGELYTDRSQSLNFTGGEGGADNQDIMRSIKRYFAQKSINSLIKEHRNATSLLDYGCGNGSFALIVHQTHADIRVTALDFHEQAPVVLEGTPVRYISSDSFIRGEEKYDIIHLKDVLEHVHNPAEFLKMLRSHLNMDGIIYIKVPNPFNTWSKLWGKSGDHLYYVPYHITHYTPKGLGNIIGLAELRGTQFGMEIPITSNYLAELFNVRLSNTMRAIGALFFPLHLLVNKVTGCSSNICCIARHSK